MDDKPRTPPPNGWKPVPSFPPGHKREGRRRCQSWNWNTGTQCEQYPIKGRERCRSHGGTVPSGPAHTQYRHGGFSKYAPRLALWVREAENDTDLRDLTADVELLFSRQIELLRRLETQEGEPLWHDLEAAFDDFLSAQEERRRAGDDERAALRAQAKANEAFTRLNALVRRGVDEARTWDLLMDVTEAKRKLVETRQRRLDKFEQYVLIGDIVQLLRGFMQALAEIHVRYNVPRAASREAVTAYERLVGGRGPAAQA